MIFFSEKGLKIFKLKKKNRTFFEESQAQFRSTAISSNVHRF